LGCTIPKIIFSLASKLGTYTSYLRLVANYSKENKIEERKKSSKAQALPCLMSIVLSFILHFVIDCWTSLS
jgi:hypothetical protein